jgi:hypothetical protein
MDRARDGRVEEGVQEGGTLEARRPSRLQGPEARRRRVDHPVPCAINENRGCRDSGIREEARSRACTDAQAEDALETSD